MKEIVEKAIDYLSRREHSRLELKRKLLKKEFNALDIDTVLSQLAEKKLQSDARFAESYVHYRRKAGFGPTRIAMELQERGVDDSLIAQYVDHTAPEWMEMLSCIWQKKFSKAERATADFHSKQKQQRFLYYRGYPSEMIDALEWPRSCP